MMQRAVKVHAQINSEEMIYMSEANPRNLCP